MVRPKFNAQTNSFQERLSKDDIRLLIRLCGVIRDVDSIPDDITDTRMQLLVGKLCRMEKQR